MVLTVRGICSRALLIVGVVAITGCPKSSAPTASIYGDVTFEEVMPQVSHDIGPFALRGAYRLKIRGTGRVVPSLSGAILMVPFTKFRMEVRGPVGGPLFTGVSDGTGMGFYLASENIWVAGDDLESDIHSLTAGFGGLEDFLSMGVGRLSTSDLEPMATGTSAEGPWGSFAGTNGATATLFLDPERGLMRSLQVSDSDGEIKLIMTHTAFMLVDDVWFPEQTTYQFLGTDIEVEFNYSAWDRLGSIPNAFGVSAPAGAQVLSFSELMQRLEPIDVDESPDDDGELVQPSIVNDELNSSAATPSIDLQ